ncbi:MAG: thioredoxin domain-containing protein [Pseudonocardiaceae bacterium]|nr:thioredoxin domain-containing protein [Pseudonocardiaceae bacterium]
MVRSVQVGGAERNARKRRQQEAAKAVGKARGASGNSTRNAIVIGVVVVVVIGLAVIGGVLLNQKEAPTALQPAAESASSYDATVQSGGVVVAGAKDAPVTVEVYEDFLCPACGMLFDQSHKDVEKALASGKLKARFHLINMLDSQSDPPGYSLEAANAASCAAESGKFQRYYNTLFEKQPEEGGAGYTTDQLVELGKKVGAPADKFGRCVRRGTYKNDVQQGYQKAQQDLRKIYGDQFGTPSVVHNGRPVEAMGNPHWASDLVAKSGKDS